MHIRITDQTGKNIAIGEQPKRIVSCVPSQTELLFDLGIGESIAGITKFCVHPKDARRTKVVVGGTKNLHLEKIAALNPDFILANKEENEQSNIEWLADRFPTYISDIRTLDHALNMIKDVGAITGRIKHAHEISASISFLFQGIASHMTKPTVAYIIWKNPWMTVNRDTFIHDLLTRVGLTNVFADRMDSRYPIITLDDLKESKPSFLFLSSEPYPFRHKDTMQLKSQFPLSNIITVDGEMFSWYGSRLSRFNTDFLTDVLNSYNDA
jgi:ABC-type Fe3+-hydroxamate transport system substrate-binding protein